MRLARFPRINFSHLPTPLEPMENLSRLLGSLNLWVKRDDCTGLAGQCNDLGLKIDRVVHGTGSTGTQALFGYRSLFGTAG